MFGFFKRKPYEGSTTLSEEVEKLRALPQDATVYYVITAMSSVRKYIAHPALKACILTTMDVYRNGGSSLRFLRREQSSEAFTFDGKAKAADLADLLSIVDNEKRMKGKPLRVRMDRDDRRLSYLLPYLRWSTDPADGGMVGVAEWLRQNPIPPQP